MQVNKIQTTQNFGMALRINPGAKQKLAEKSEAYLETLKKIGKDLEGKRVDVEILDDLTPRVNTYAAAYLPPFKPEKPIDNILYVSTKFDGPNVYKKGKIDTTCYRLVNEEEASKAYENINNAKTDVEKAAEFAKVIDKNIRIKVQERNLEAERALKQQNLADELIQLFGRGNLLIR